MQKYAGFWIRLLAKIIDWLVIFILFLPGFLISVYINHLKGIYPLSSGPPTFFYIYSFLCFIFAIILYDPFFIKKYGATPGKMLLKLKVIKADNSKISWGDSFLRWFIYKLGSGWWVLFLGVISIAWDKKKQGWHDKAAKTIVIRNQP